MTRRGRAKFQSCVALLACLLLLVLPTSRARDKDVSSNEVLPGSRGNVGARVNNGTAPANASSRVIVCPIDPPNVLNRLLGVICDKNADCRFLGQDQRCCKNICRRGIEPPPYEPPHGELLGIRRKCPSQTFPERLPVKRCAKDEDCEGVNRICCPDKKDNKLYCKTAAPIWSSLSLPDNFDGIKNLMGFVQCQPAPPTIIDIFTHSCNKSLDCLPNLCCQEGSKKVCRPPQRSILSFAAQATSKFVRG